MKYWIAAFLLMPILSYAQDTPVAAEFLPSGGGEYGETQTGHPGCIGAEERQAIEALLAKNVADLKARGLLPETDTRSVIAFERPTRNAAALPWYGHFGISNYLDQDAASGTLDHYCGTRTYNGHTGLDMFSWPFPWWLMEHDLVEVVAAAPGTIIGKQDGYSSYSCDWNGNQFWNAVYVQHADGSVAWYGHLKQASLTAKPIGGKVETGEFLGIMGSSGRSSGPHLHFEVYRQMPTNAANRIDPFEGVCNSLNAESWWQMQETYRVPGLITLASHDAEMKFGCLLDVEKNNFRGHFQPGQKMYLARYYRDQTQGTESVMRVYRPDGSQFQEWKHLSPGTYNASYWYDTWTIPASAPTGKWRFETTYQGVTLEHPFWIGVQPACTVELSLQAASVCLGDTATLNATGAGGVPPYFFQWDNGLGSGATKRVSPTGSTTYAVTVTDAFGCSAGSGSVEVQVDLPPDTGVTVIGNLLVSDQSTGSWQWIDCAAGGTPIAGADGPSFEAPTSGEYAVIVQSGTCPADTSACVPVLFVSLDEARGDDAPFRVHPNPCGPLLRLVAERPMEDARFTLYDLFGRPALSMEAGTGSVWNWVVSSLPAGRYTLESRLGDQVFQQPLLLTGRP